MKYGQVFTFLTMLLFASACNGPAKTGLVSEKEHPKLIKTIGNPGYGNVQCGMQDKAGNLWFGTTQNGPFLKQLINPWIWAIVKIQVEIFGWGRERQVSTFSMPGCRMDRYKHY